jgi:hypothetical protein
MMGIKDVARWWMVEPARVRAAARFLGALQRSGQRLTGWQAAWFRQLSIPVKADLQPLGQQLAGMRRRLRDLDEKLDALKKRS